MQNVTGENEYPWFFESVDKAPFRAGHSEPASVF
jgi:hypothetical protein